MVLRHALVNECFSFIPGSFPLIPNGYTSTICLRIEGDQTHLACKTGNANQPWKKERGSGGNTVIRLRNARAHLPLRIGRAYKFSLLFFFLSRMMPWYHATTVSRADNVEMAPVVAAERSSRQLEPRDRTSGKISSAATNGHAVVIVHNCHSISEENCQRLEQDESPDSPDLEVQNETEPLRHQSPQKLQAGPLSEKEREHELHREQSLESSSSLLSL